MSKCIQLYDIIAVRHGIMVLGDANSGKSVVMKLLAESMNI